MADEFSGRVCIICDKKYNPHHSGWTYFSFDGTITCSDKCKKIHIDNPIDLRKHDNAS
jgi:hypothetical protein